MGRLWGALPFGEVVLDDAVREQVTQELWGDSNPKPCVLNALNEATKTQTT